MNPSYRQSQRDNTNASPRVDSHRTVRPAIDCTGPSPRMRTFSVGLFLPTLAALLCFAVSGPLHAHEEPSLRIQSLSKAIQQSPNDHNLRLRRARLYREEGHWKSARKDVRKALALSGNAPSAAVQLEYGLVWLAGGHPTRAIRWLTRAIRGAPGVPEAWQGRGLAWAKRRRFSKAIGDYSRAIALQPTPDRYIQRGQWQERVGTTDAAIQGYEDGMRRLNEPVSLRLALIRLHTQQKQYGMAIARIQPMEKQHPHVAEWPLRRANILCLAGKNAEAMAAYREGLKDAKDAHRRRPTALADTHRAWAFLGLGDAALARKILTDVLKKHPKLAPARELQTHLKNGFPGCQRP